MNALGVKRAALYARISQAVDDTDKTANQVARLRLAATEAGYRVVAEYTDDDVSAYRGKYQRPGFDALLVAVKSGEVDVVMATEQERLTRGDAVAQQTLQVLCVQAGAVLHFLSSGVQDPKDPMTAAFLGITDIIGGLEVAVKTARQNARNQDELAAGKALWGQRRFGFEDRHTLRESEAQLIRDAYRAVFAGATLYSIAKAWNDAGVKTARAGVSIKRDGNTRTVSGLWSTNTVKKVLLNPSTAGVLMHKGVEQPHSALPAIVSREDWEAMRALLGDDARKPQSGHEVKHLLTGLMRCQCGATMTKGTVNSRGYKYDVYRCRDAGKPSTGTHGYIRTNKADAAVVREVFHWVAEHPEEQPELGGTKLPTLLSELGELKRQRGVVQELAMMPGADLTDTRRRLSELGTSIDQVQTQIDAERAAAAGTGLVEAVRLDYWSDTSLTHAERVAEQDKAEAEFSEWFGSLTIEKRRELVRAMFSVELLAKDDPRAIEQEGDRMWIDYRF